MSHDLKRNRENNNILKLNKNKSYHTKNLRYVLRLTYCSARFYYDFIIIILLWKHILKQLCNPPQLEAEKEQQMEPKTNRNLNIIAKNTATVNR